MPYALPDKNWVWRSAFDVGEYNIGQYAEALRKNVDVPENAVFLDESVMSDTGSADGAYTLRGPWRSTSATPGRSGIASIRPRTSGMHASPASSW